MFLRKEQTFQTYIADLRLLIYFCLQVLEDGLVDHGCGDLCVGMMWEFGALVFYEARRLKATK